MFVPGITYPKLQNISLKGAERMKKARAMAVLVIVAVLVCAAFAISKNSAEKRKQMIAQKYGITQENTKNVIKIEENVCKTQESDSKTQESAQEVPESVIIPGKMKQGIH